MEDFGHEFFLTALIQRIAEELGAEVSVYPRSARGGRGAVLSELKEYVRDVVAGRETVPDRLVVATDANCRGLATRSREVEAAGGDFEKIRPQSLALAVPDPHIERWMLVDSQAFKAVFGKGCKAPDLKCERDRYKQLLRDAMHDVGISPPLGGMEYADEIVAALDLSRVFSLDASLGATVREIRRILK